MDLGVGIIGCGFIGRVHALSYQTLGYYYEPAPANVRVVGVCTSRPETAEAARKSVNAEFGTSDVGELLARNDIHLISVCTPNHLHAPNVLASFQAGKHVYCDKPLAANAVEAKQILDAQKVHPDLVGQVTFQYRFAPATLRAKQLVDEGFLGKVFSFRACYLHAGYVDADRPMSWRMDVKQGGGGALFDLGSHAIDLITHLLGDCKRVFGTLKTYIPDRPEKKGSTKRLPVEVDDIAWLKMELANGAVGTIEASRLATGANDELRFEIHGEKGAMRWNLMDPAWLDVYDMRDSEGAYGGNRGFKRIECCNRYPEPKGFPGPKFNPGWMRFHIASIQDFVKNVTEKKKPGPDFRQGLHVQQIMAAAQESNKIGSWKEI